MHLDLREVPAELKKKKEKKETEEKLLFDCQVTARE